MPRKFHKHKLLLDEGFHLRIRLPRTNSRYDVKHVAADYKRNGIPDAEVYNLAEKEGRLLITYNIKDFMDLIAENAKTGVIGVSPNISVEQIDKKLTALLVKSNKKTLLGKVTKITEEATG